MATKHDLDLAKLLLSSRVLDEAALRQAFEQQGKWLHEGRVAALPEVLYALGLLPQGALAAVGAAGPEVTQPFPGYRIDGVVGEGGMSTVYAATQLMTGARVALKVMKPLVALRADFVQRFEQEGRLLLRLEHPGIVPAYDVGQAGGYHYFAMELIGGCTVQEVIERRGHLSNSEALSITAQVAEALDYLHGQGLLHRDMKPGNVMVEPSGRARLIDLGLVGRLEAPGARAGGAGGSGEASGGSDPGGATTGGTTVGTVEYLSPEQARGRSDLDARTDVYSLGVSLYHMVVGEVPFQGENDMEVMAKQIMASIDQEKVKTRRISPELHFFIAKMTAKEREARFGTMKDVLREVRGYLPEGLVAVDLGGPARVIPVGPAHSAAAGRAVPTARPIAAPVVRPVAAPALRPVVPPVALPVAQPVAHPVAHPVARPVVPPLKAPAPRPPGAASPPTVPPVLRPVAPQVVRPVVPPVVKPVTAVPPVVKPPASTAPVLKPLAPPVVPPIVKPMAPAPPVLKPVVPPAPPPVVRPVAPAAPPDPAPSTPAPSTPAPSSPAPAAPKPNPFAGKAPVPKHKR